MYAVFLAVYVSFEQRQRFLERRLQILCLAGLVVAFFLHDVPHDWPRSKDSSGRLPILAKPREDEAADLAC